MLLLMLKTVIAKALWSLASEIWCGLPHEEKIKATNCQVACGSETSSLRPRPEPPGCQRSPRMRLQVARSTKTHIRRYYTKQDSTSQERASAPDRAAPGLQQAIQGRVTRHLARPAGASCFPAVFSGRAWRNSLDQGC